MSETLRTLCRHLATYVVGLLVAFFTVHLTAPAELKSATEAANALLEPLVILIGAAGVILTRLAMPVIDKIFRRGGGDDGSGSGGIPLLVAWCVVGALVVVTLPACSSMTDAARALPIKATLLLPDGTLSYSSKDGIKATLYSASTHEWTIDRRSHK